MSRVRGRRDIKFPLFLECVKYTSDMFWQNFYEDLAYGKYPKSIYLMNGMIHSSNKRKAFSYNFSNKTPKQIVDELYVILIENTTICSKKDDKAKKSSLQEICSTIKDEKPIKWTSVRKKVTKDIYIQNFVLRMKKEYDLNWSKASSLLYTINIGILNKIITSQDINFVDGEIESINKLIFDPKLKTLILPEIESLSEQTSENVLDPEEKSECFLTSYWPSYLKSKMKELS
jgi:hypothetical protein